MNKISSGISQLDNVLCGGYPLNSAILIEGIPGIGKEFLGYSLIFEGIKNRDNSTVFTTKLMNDVVEEITGYGYGNLDKKNVVRFELKQSSENIKLLDPMELSLNIKESIEKNGGG